MDFYDIDWGRSGTDIFEQIRRWQRSVELQNIQMLDSFAGTLKEKDLFDHGEFRRTRPRFGSQSEWSQRVGVSQATIGNYERGKTYPNAEIRAAILNASKEFRKDAVKRAEGFDGPKYHVDPVNAKEALDRSILRASLTDFEFDAESQQIVAVPFEGDVVDSGIDQIEAAKADLLDALSRQTEDLAESLEKGANANVSRMVESLRRYGSEAAKAKCNPRFLYRYGSTIARGASNEDITFAINDWDRGALDGFVDDHTELMRLYYREALAKAQEIDAAQLAENAEMPKANDFFKIAGIIEDARDQDGERLFSQDISTLLRDVGRDVQENEENEILTTDDERKQILRRRRVEAVKHGAVVLGRFMIFASFVVAINPMMALATAGSVASILGLVEQKRPGLLRSYYDRLRGSLPFLPKFPSQ